jgi:hypothetical protein
MTWYEVHGMVLETFVLKNRNQVVILYNIQAPNIWLDKEGQWGIKLIHKNYVNVNHKD